MRHGDGVICFGGKVDVHCAIAQIDLLIALGAAGTIRSPALTRFVLLFLRLTALKVILKEKLAEFLSGNGGGKGD
jgi:hypothetical protein